MAKQESSDVISKNDNIEKFQRNLIESKDLEKQFTELCNVANSIFKSNFGLNHKFTYEDMKLDAKEKNIDPNIQTKLNLVCDMLNEMEFDKEKINKGKLLECSHRLGELIDETAGVKVDGAENAKDFNIKMKKTDDLFDKDFFDKKADKFTEKHDVPELSGGTGFLEKIRSRFKPKKLEPHKEDELQVEAMLKEPFGEESIETPEFKEPIENPPESVEKVTKMPKIEEPELDLEIEVAETDQKKIPGEETLPRFDVAEEFEVDIEVLKDKPAETKPKDEKIHIPEKISLAEQAEINKQVKEIAELKKHVFDEKIPAPEPSVEKEPVEEIKQPGVELKPFVEVHKIKKVELAKVERLPNAKKLSKVKKHVLAKKIKEKLIVKKTKHKLVVKKIAKPKKLVVKPRFKKVKTVKAKPKIALKAKPKIVQKIKPQLAKKQVEKPKVKTIKAKPEISLKPKKVEKPLVKKVKKIKTFPKIPESKLTKEVKKLVELPRVKLAKLPEFKELRKKEKSIRHSLVDIVKNLTRGKKQISEQIDIIERQKKVIEAERKHFKELPLFTNFDEKLKEEKAALDEKEKELLKREKDIDTKLKSISTMEKHLNEWTKRLHKDERSVKKEKEFLKNKEILIKDIRKELNKKYELTIKEIKKIREELKDKQTNFLKLQKFYRLRENKLSVEEGNLLQEKKGYAKLISSLIKKHIEVILSDIGKTVKQTNRVKHKIIDSDNKIKDYQEKISKVKAETEKTDTEMRDKKKYFADLEDEFKGRDPEFKKLNELLNSRMKRLRSKEPQLTKYSINIDKTKHEVDKKEHALSIRELELKSIEKEIDRLRFAVGNKESRLNLRETQLEKRISSFDRLNKEVRSSIAREKRAVKRLEKKLIHKARNISSRLNVAKKSEKMYRFVDDALYESDKHYEEKPKSIKLGNPNILDILRLLNIAKDFLAHEQVNKARDVYLEVQRIFDELDDNERQEIYAEIIKVFKVQKPYEHAFTNPDNIEGLIFKFQELVDQGDLHSSELIYSKLQEKYAELTDAERDKYYPKILAIYNRVLEHHMTTATA